MAEFFPGFDRRRIETSGASINLVTGGSGPPLLLLHGYPQTHVMWRKVAPRLAQEFSVVIPDLRGYGDSSKPPAGPDHAAYSKRALAQDQVETMAALGFERFRVAGHDRADRGRKVAMPLVVLWGQRSGQGTGYDVLAVWREHADNVTGQAIPSGHFIPEEAPDEAYRALRDFFAA